MVLAPHARNYYSTADASHAPPACPDVQATSRRDPAPLLPLALSILLLLLLLLSIPNDGLPSLAAISPAAFVPSSLAPLLRRKTPTDLPQLWPRPRLVPTGSLSWTDVRRTQRAGSSRSNPLPPLAPLAVVLSPGSESNRAFAAESDPQQSRGWQFFRSLGSPRVWLAPMVDASELPFRLLTKRYGVDAAYTPMLHSRIFTEVARYRKDYFSTCPEDRPLLAQFCANDPDTFVKAAKLVQHDCSGIDLNLGCPQRIARSGNYGAFLMDDVDLVERLVRKAVAELDVPVTVKIRVFPDDEQTLAYVRRLRDAGAYMIGVHGRTRDQKSAEKYRANWDIIRKVVEALPDVPIIANGNVRHWQDVQDCLQYTGAAAVMSAQSLLDDPAALAPPAHPIRARPDRPAALMAEYLDLVEAHPVPLQMVHGHMHAALGPWLAEFTDFREDLNRIPKRKKRIKIRPQLPAYRAVAHGVQQRILEVYRQEGRTYPIPMKEPEEPTVQRPRQRSGSRLPSPSPSPSTLDEGLPLVPNGPQALALLAAGLSFASPPPTDSDSDSDTDGDDAQH